MISEEPLGRNLQTKLGGKQRQKMLLFLLMMGSSAAVPPEFKKNFNKRPSCKVVPLTRWKQNKPDSAACVWFLFLSFPFLWIWSLFCTELKGSQVWQVRASWLDSCQSHSEREGIAESRITGGGLVALTAERQIQCVQHTVHRSCYDTHARTHASTLRHTHAHIHLHGWFYCHGNQWLIPWVMLWEREY